MALQEVVHAGRDGRLFQYNDLVRETAKAGFALYEALFFGDGKEDKKTAALARHWLEHPDRKQEKYVIIINPPLIHFPWGLIYDQPVQTGHRSHRVQETFLV